jgi:hypothetical protein
LLDFLLFQPKEPVLKVYSHDNYPDWAGSKYLYKLWFQGVLEDSSGTRANHAMLYINL